MSLKQQSSSIVQVRDCAEGVGSGPFLPVPLTLKVAYDSITYTGMSPKQPADFWSLSESDLHCSLAADAVSPRYSLCSSGSSSMQVRAYKIARHMRSRRWIFYFSSVVRRAMLFFSLAIVERSCVACSAPPRPVKSASRRCSHLLLHFKGKRSHES